MIGLSSIVLCAVLCFNVYVSAKPADQGKCLMGSWGDWGKCTPDKLCLGENHRSYPKQMATWDEGRTRMAEMMRMKEESWRTRTREYVNSEGYFKCTDGFANGYPCWNVDQLSFLNIEDLGYHTPAPGESVKELNDVWGWTDPLTGREYAIVGLSGGSSFVDVTDPYTPLVLGFMYTASSAAVWRDMKVVNDHAYIVADVNDHGMQVFDLARLRGLTPDNTRQFEPDVWYREFGNSHNIAENKGKGYVVAVGNTRGLYPNNCAGGLHIVDVSDPKNPRFAGCFPDDGYVHDTQCVTYDGPDGRYTGREVCFCYNEDSFTVVDITAPASGVLISKRAYNGYDYTHQGWCTPDLTICIMDDEGDERASTVKNTRSYVWDIRDLENPILMDTFYSAETSIDHNMYILNDYVYQSNYQAGLQLLHLDAPNYNLTRVGYFDVFPESTLAAFAGTWSNYPYFNSGAVALTSIEYGLFMVQPDWAAIETELATQGTHSQQYRTRPVIQQPAGVSCDPAEEFQSCPRADVNC